MNSARPSAYGFSTRHAFLILDGSLSMQGEELASGLPKHRQVSWMVGQLVDRLGEPAFDETYLSINVYDAQPQPDGRYLPCIEERLVRYNTQTATYQGQEDLTLWDPLNGHGGATPIGAALAHGVEQAEAWINDASGSEQRRAVIFLLSDGMNNVGDDGRSLRARIDLFNRECAHGQLRLATIGYFQHPQGEDAEEDAGRELLRALPTNPHAYFESGDVEKILAYIVATITVLG